MELRATSLDDLVSLRRAKVESLRVRCFALDHEEQVRAATAYRVSEGQAETGYVFYLSSWNNDPTVQNRLLEFDVAVPWRGRTDAYLEETIGSLQVKQIEVRSDDGMALEAVLAFASKHGWDTRPIKTIYSLETGILRRPAKPEGAELRLLTSEESDQAKVLFEAEEELPAAARSAESVNSAIEANRMWGLYHDGNLVGAAEVLLQDFQRYADLRPVIHPDSRRAGLATYLIGELSKTLLTTNYRLMTQAQTGTRVIRRIAEKLGLTLTAHVLLVRAI